MRIAILNISIASLVLCVAPVAWAVPTTVTHQDILNCCDTLVVPTSVDELGTFIFPPNETIVTSDQLATYLSCPSQANPAIFGTQVSITNMTGLSFSNLWYVADPETTFTNVDGTVNGEHAFKIDAVGINTPLVFESINTNGIFEPLEVWDFVIDGYFNTFGLPASAMQSIGVGPFSVADQKSSGSIIGTPIPEPASTALLACALAGAGLVRRR